LQELTLETETDQSLPPSRRHEVEGLLAKKNATYQINLYSGASHGFAVRVDLKNERQVYAKEAAFVQAMLWFDKWLKGAPLTGSKYVSSGDQEFGKDLRVQHDFEYTSSN
jgi:dienelactone hydrolase